jgi:hypothetical protein
MLRNDVSAKSMSGVFDARAVLLGTRAARPP